MLNAMRRAHEVVKEFGQVGSVFVLEQEEVLFLDHVHKDQQGLLCFLGGGLKQRVEDLRVVCSEEKMDILASAQEREKYAFELSNNEKVSSQVRDDQE